LLKDIEEPIDCVAISPDSRWLALGLHTALMLWNLAESPPKLYWLFRHWNYHFTRLGFRSDSPTLLAARSSNSPGREDHFLAWWNVMCTTPTEFEVRMSLQGHSSVFSSDSNWLAGIDRHALVLGETRKHGRSARLESDPRFSLQSLTFSPDGQTLATVDEAGRVQLWPWRSLVDA
jgi:WD40 repeat protein